MEGSLLRQKILPSILVVLSATVLLTGQASSGEPTADECRIRPGASTPQGTRWYYRVDRMNNRHCWYLSSEKVQLPSHARAAMSQGASPSPTPQRENATDKAPSQAASSQIAHAQVAPAQMTSAEAAFLEPSVRELVPVIDFAARWLDLRKSLDLAGYQRTAIDTERQKPLTSPVVEAEGVGLQQDSADQATFESVSLIGAFVMASLLLAGVVFKLARPPYQWYLRDHWCAAAGRPGPRWYMRADFAARHDDSVWRAPTPTDPAQDLKTSLWELMRDLQRADAASDSHRSFAPLARQMPNGATDPKLSKSNGFTGRSDSDFQIVKSQPMQFGKVAGRSHRGGVLLPETVS